MAISTSYLKERQDSAQTSKSERKHNRTGTLPFMALGLLNDDPDLHNLCHDLELIMWIFIAALAHDSQSDPPYPLKIAKMVNSQRRNDCPYCQIWYMYMMQSTQKCYSVSPAGDLSKIHNKSRFLNLSSITSSMKLSLSKNQPE